MKRLLLLPCLFLVMSPSVSEAQWRLDGAPVCTAVGSQSGQSTVADGAAGINIAWDDTRSGTFDIYVQRVNSSGVGQWTSNGVALCTAANHQTAPVIALDATAGAIVAWEDLRNGIEDIYARRVSSAGAPLWTADGVAICTAANFQLEPSIIADGSGGAVIAWKDYRSGTNWDVYAQRINSSGVAQWAANGVPVCVAANDQYAPRIVSDGAGGVILAWEDMRAGNLDLFVQRINSAGAPQWALNGAAIADLPSAAQFQKIASDGAAGAIVVWEDHRNATPDIFAQRVSAAGVSQWTVQGVAVCIAAGAQNEPVIAADGAGGALITWDDNRAGNYDLYAQKITSSGAPQWLANGAPVGVLGGDQQKPAITTDAAGGAILSWLDGRSGYDLPYAQRLDVAGVPQWPTNGVPLITVAADQGVPVIQPDGSGNAVIAWTDYRTGITDIYAQRVEGIYGYWGRPDPILNAVSDIRKDQGGKVALDWKASARDVPVPATISFYSIWRAVTVAPLNQTVGGPALLTLDRVGRDTPAGTLMKSPASSYYWELVGTQEAYRWPNYSFSADTRADSVAGNTATTYFMVAAHSLINNDVAFPSNVISGHSVDNLAPIAPLGLVAQRIGNYVHLKWNRVHVADMRDYSVYRKTSSGVTPIPANFLGAASDTVLTDSSPPASAAYYIVTANDVHANQSTKSNEAAVGASTGVGNLPPITALMVLQNHPNPFASVTQFEIGLPAKSDVVVGVYDVAGRKVMTQVLTGQKAGWQTIRLEGLDDARHPLPSGVYFYRISAGGASTTRKFVIAR
jgi:hypothetical protein